MEADPANYQVVLPINQILKGISNETAPNAQFLVGYRNVIVEKDGTTSWGLSKSQLHCGRAFVFAISEKEALSIEHLKGKDENIERVGNSFIVLKANPNEAKPASKMSIQTTKKLLEELGGVNKINLNIIKNAFDNFQEYRSIIDEDTERALALKQPTNEIDAIERVKIEINAKNLSGANLRKLPLISKQTGDWIEGDGVEMKVLEH